jgi:hypothetical protein
MSTEVLHGKLFKSWGPCQGRKQANPGSYGIQKLPLLNGLGSTYPQVKDSVARMECIPSTLIVHKY